MDASFVCCHTSEIERNTTGKRAPAEGNLFIYRQTCVRAGIRREYGKSRKTRSSRSSNGTKTECDEGKEKERKRETDDGEEENGKPRQERKREREGESGNANRGRGDRDFWARALHLLACSGTRHTHRLLPATPVVTHAAASSLSPLLLSSLHPSGPVYLLLSLSLPRACPPGPTAAAVAAAVALSPLAGIPLPCSSHACRGHEETGTHGSQSLAVFDRASTQGPCTLLFFFPVRSFPPPSRVVSSWFRPFDEISTVDSPPHVRSPTELFLPRRSRDVRARARICTITTKINRERGKKRETEKKRSEERGKQEQRRLTGANEPYLRRSRLN